MASIKENIQKNIAKYRKSEGLTQKQLASKLGIVPTTVASWEQGKSSPDVDTLIKICEILNTNVTAMYEYEAPEIEKSLSGAVNFLKQMTTDSFKAGTQFASINADEEKLLSAYRLLNAEGKEKALDYIEDLASMDKYKNNNISQMVEKNA